MGFSGKHEKTAPDSTSKSPPPSVPPEEPESISTVSKVAAKNQLGRGGSR